jgi:hypothetical protein
VPIENRPGGWDQQHNEHNREERRHGVPGTSGYASGAGRMVLQR